MSVPEASSAPSQCALLLSVTTAAATAVLWVDLEAPFPAVSRTDVLEMYHASPWQSDSSLVLCLVFQEKSRIKQCHSSDAGFTIK